MRGANRACSERTATVSGGGLKLLSGEHAEMPAISKADVTDTLHRGMLGP